MVVAPTKSNLMRSQAALKLSQKGFDLLDRKRNVLIQEMMELVEKAKRVQNQIHDTIDEAYHSLQVVNMTMGIKNVEEIADAMQKDESFDILLKSVMGVDIPTIKYTSQEITPTYSLQNTNAALDLATKKFKEVQELMYQFAELDNSIFKLAKEIEKTQKRTNALEHIQIPKYTEQVKYIGDVLEEKEREDFSRLKRIKSR